MKTEEVYFKSENDAEAARTELEAFRVSDVTVESVPEKNDGIKKPFIPLAPGFTGPTGLEASPLKNKDKLQEERKETLTHLLRFKVDEQEHEKVMKLLEKSDGYKEHVED